MNIFTVYAAVRYLINAFAMPLVTARFFAKNTISGVQVYRPASVSYGISMGTLFNYVLLFHNIVAHKPAAFTFPGYHTHPFQRKGFGFRKFARVFNIVPGAVNNFP